MEKRGLLIRKKKEKITLRMICENLRDSAGKKKEKRKKICECSAKISETLREIKLNEW